MKLKTRNILLVTSDGLRWQEVFGGADSALMNKEDGGVVNPSLLKSEFGGDKPEVRRKLLMPFLWTTIAKNGQIFGNVNAGSEVRVTNGKNFSYPGYNEILTGVGGPQDHEQPQDTQPECDGPGMAQRPGRLPQPGRGLRVVGRLPVHRQPMAKPRPGRRRLASRSWAWGSRRKSS